MKSRKHLTLYILLAVLMVVDLYAIFNTGNPNSLFRFIIKDPGWDFLTTMIISASIVLIVILMNTSKPKMDDPVYSLLRQNKEYIQKLRDKGKSDTEIAASFAENMKVGPLAKKVAYRKAVRFLKLL